MSKNVIVTGVTGQDGSYMVDYLMDNTDYKIFGLVRRASNPDYKNISTHRNNPRFQMIIGDLSDSQSMDTVVKKYQPDYFLNFAAQSFVGSSWDIPEQTFDVDAMGVLRILEAIRKHKPSCRFYSAGSSEEFGDVVTVPQNETHPLRPRSPYGAAKCSARHITKVYRESYDLYAIQAWLYNHESPRRGEEFVTRKITKNLCHIKKLIDMHLPFDPLRLGNIEAKRDWSHAKDFIDAIWRMMNQEIYNKEYTRPFAPSEYVVASNETHSIREFLEIVMNQLDINYEIRGELGTLSEQWIHNETGQVLMSIDEQYYRPAEVELLHGDPSRIKNDLGWQPEYSFEGLVREMVNYDLK